MDCFYNLVTNKFLLAPILSWFFCQVLKTVLYAVKNQKLDLKRFVGDGGMPSAHSSIVVALTMISALNFGVGSFEFAFALLFMLVVCRDAMGVRRETGKQSRLLIKMKSSVEKISNDVFPDEELKEHGGHTVPEVCIGGLIGIAAAIVIHFVF